MPGFRETKEYRPAAVVTVCCSSPVAWLIAVTLAPGTIAPEGGCPGNFFTSRKWTYERSALIIRDHKGEVLAELAFAGGRFEGQGSGAALSLSR